MKDQLTLDTQQTNKADSGFNPLDAFVMLRGDCLDIMSTISDNSIDFVFLDPPFNLKKIYLDKYDDNLSKAEYLDWQYQVIKKSFRILKNTGNLVYHNIPKWAYKVANYADDFGVFQNWIVWDNGGSLPTPSRLYPKHYSFLWFSKTSNKTFNKQYIPIQTCRKCGVSVKDYGGKYKNLKEINGNRVTVLSDVWTDLHRIKHRKNKNRDENELPESIMTRLVAMLTDENQTVLDPFMGSGTTASVCKKLNRRFIGIDYVEEYVELAKQRIEAT